MSLIERVRSLSLGRRRSLHEFDWYVPGFSYRYICLIVDTNSQKARFFRKVILFTTARSVHVYTCAPKKNALRKGRIRHVSFYIIMHTVLSYKCHIDHGWWRDGKRKIWIEGNCGRSTVVDTILNIPVGFFQKVLDNRHVVKFNAADEWIPSCESDLMSAMIDTINTIPHTIPHWSIIYVSTFTFSWSFGIQSGPKKSHIATCKRDTEGEFIPVRLFVCPR